MIDGAHNKKRNTVFTGTMETVVLICVRLAKNPTERTTWEIKHLANSFGLGRAKREKS